MKIKCVYNTGKVLLEYDRRPESSSKHTTFGQLEIGEEYLVMGILMREGYLLYIIDSLGVISGCPSQLFEVIDEKIPLNLYYKSFKKDFKDYVNKESIFGYKELVFDSSHYEKLLEMEEEAHGIYFKRKMETENRINSNV